ncbi:sugar phosphate isomerase [bacterium]|nr:sugar phosphate isomerase [bacterium]
MPSPREKAQQFLRDETQFRLGALTTERPHPVTRQFSQIIQENLPAGISLIQQVDRDLISVSRRQIGSPVFEDLATSMIQTLRAGGRIWFTGCGATGRLSILLDAMWRRFWQRLRTDSPATSPLADDMEDRTRSTMAGGDYALIRSVEGFEDFDGFGRHQIRQAGLAKGDVVVAITEGGETSFVIGTAWEAVETGAKAFFVFNNPADELAERVERSRAVLEEEAIAKIELASGPMAIAGSTRMQATTIELLVVGAALETALVRLLSERSISIPDSWSISPNSYIEQFVQLLSDLESPLATSALSRIVRFEETIYQSHGRVTYAGSDYLLDIFTDTTERSPTFSLPPFRPSGDTGAPPSWAFVKHPMLDSEQAWSDILAREPRCLDWNSDTYRNLNAPEALRARPPRLDIAELMRFRVGREPDPSRHETAENLAVLILAGDGIQSRLRPQDPFRESFSRLSEPFKNTAGLFIGPDHVQTDIVEESIAIPCRLPETPLHLWHHLAIKLALNTLSTATMARMGRVVGNWMVHVSASNKKLIDRGIRLVSELSGLDYNAACLSLFETMESLEETSTPGTEKPSPVAETVRRLTQSQS